jgi:hypothetical protein
MNTEHFNQWINRLRTTDVNQTPGVLSVRYPDGVKAMCCLGVGCVEAGIPFIEVRAGDHYPYDPEQGEGFEASMQGVESEDDVIYAFAGTGNDPGVETTTRNEVELFFMDLPPNEFNQWLGLPAGVLMLDTRIPERHLHRGGEVVDGPPRVWKLFQLNDDGFTFSQIADLMEHFGIAVLNDD